MRILQVKFTRSPEAAKTLPAAGGPAPIPAEWSLDLEALHGEGSLKAAPWLPDLLGTALYGSAWPQGRAGSLLRGWDVPGMVEAVAEAAGREGTPARYRICRELCVEAGVRGPGRTSARGLHGPMTVVREEAAGPAPLSPGELDSLLGPSPEAFLRGTLLPQRGFAALLRMPPVDRGAALEMMLGPGLWGEASALSCQGFLVRKPLDGRPENVESLRAELARTLDELGTMEVLLDRRAEEERRQEALGRSEAELRELDRRRGDWERSRALFAPLQQRLERGRAVLELGDDYAGLRALRQGQEQNRLEQMGVREDIANARDELQSVEEAVTLLEGGFRDRLAAQKRLGETAQTVQDLDRQIQVHQEEAESVRSRLGEAAERLRERSSRVEGDQARIERLGLSLREARKFLQSHVIDERLGTGLPAIQKCFDLFMRAQERLNSLKGSYAASLRRKQQAQESLNDRQAMFSGITFRFNAAEKERDRARSAFDSTLKGRDLDSWREECGQHRQRIEAMDALARRLAEEKELQDRLKTLRESRQRMQQESRSLNIREVEQAGKMGELQAEVEKLEKRVSLLQRIEDLDALRELLQDGVPCPLCGSVTHPYVAGGAHLAPDPDEAHRQLREAQMALDALRDELSSRQARSGLLTEELATAGQGEEALLRELHTLGDQIAQESAALGLKFGVGVPPSEELDRVRQRERDLLQRAAGVVDAAEAAKQTLREAEDELERLRESREELARYHQEALFQLQAQRAEEERLEGESRGQEESFNGLRRELMAQLSAYGYKNLPDEDPASVIRALVERSGAWQEQKRRKEELERELAVAQAALAGLKKERDGLSLERDELATRLRAIESERDSVQQQRIVLFGARDPAAEVGRMARDVEDLRTQLEARRQEKAASSSRLQELQEALHGLETDMSVGRERLQKDEIAFGKKLLASGFKNEDDYLSASLTDEERTSLQGRLKDLTQADLELTAARENARASQLELQARQEGRVSLGDRTVFLRRLLELNRRAGELYLSLRGDAEAERLYRGFAERLARRPRLRDLGLGTGDEGTRAQLLALAFDAVVARANARLTAGGEALRLRRGEGPLELVPEAGGAVDLPLAALALAWGLADLFIPSSSTVSPRLVDFEEGDGERARAHVRVMRREGEEVLAVER